eukprot:gene49131-60139_t
MSDKEQKSSSDYGAGAAELAAPGTAILAASAASNTRRVSAYLRELESYIQGEDASHSHSNSRSVSTETEPATGGAAGNSTLEDIHQAFLLSSHTHTQRRSPSPSRSSRSRSRVGREDEEFAEEDSLDAPDPLFDLSGDSHLV